MKTKKLTKLSLEQFTVKSFTTSLESHDVNTVKGGTRLACAPTFLSDCTLDSMMGPNCGPGSALCPLTTIGSH